MNIELIPVVMRNRHGWDTAPRLMERWFSSPGNPDPETGPPDRHIVRLGWALGFLRARQAFDEIVSSRAWLSDTARQSIVSWLRSQNKLGPEPATFGVPDYHTASPQTLTEATIHSRSVGGMMDILDDMFGALGRFDLRVIVSGSVSPVAGSRTVPGTARASVDRSPAASGHEIRIEEVGIYLWDSFDFNGHQFLGFWCMDGVRMTPALGYDAVWNGDFRDFRTRHGRGGDFYVFSDLHTLRRSPPDTFTT